MLCDSRPRPGTGNRCATAATAGVAARAATAGAGGHPGPECERPAARGPARAIFCCLRSNAWAISRLCCLTSRETILCVQPVDWGYSRQAQVHGVLQSLPDPGNPGTPRGLRRPRPGRPPDPVALLRDAPPLRHCHAHGARLHAGDARPGVAVPVRGHGAGAAAHRAHQVGRRLRHPRPLAAGQRLRGHVLPQRDRHRRQDPARRRGRGRPLVGGGRAQPAGVHPRLRRARLPAAGRRAAGDRARARDDRADAAG